MCSKDLTCPEYPASVLVFCEINRNLILHECFSALLSILRRYQNNSRHLYTMTPSEQGVSVVWLSATDSKKVSQLTNLLSLTTLLPFHVRKIFEIEPLKSVSIRQGSCGLPEITNQHCTRKQGKQVRRAAECFSSVHTQNRVALRSASTALQALLVHTGVTAHAVV